MGIKVFDSDVLEQRKIAFEKLLESSTIVSILKAQDNNIASAMQWINEAIDETGTYLSEDLTWTELAQLEDYITTMLRLRKLGH